MSMLVLKSSMAREDAVKIAEQCYIVEEIGYMEKKLNVVPKVLRMYESEELFFKIPYHVAFMKGYKPIDTQGNHFPWYCIQPLLVDMNKNIWDLDMNSSFIRPFNEPFRDYQGEVINDLLEQLGHYCTTTLGLPPGWGKTMASIFIGWRVGLRICVIIPLLLVLDGWRETCRKFMPYFKTWVVGEGSCPEDVDIILCMDERFIHIPKHIIPTIGTLIVDEVHMLCTPTLLDIYLNIFPKYILMISATFRKKKGFRQIGKLMGGEHMVFRVSKIPYNVFVVETGIMGEEERSKTGDLISTKLRADLAKNEFRQNITCMIAMQNCNYHKIMTRRSVKAGIEQLVQKINNCGITCDSMYGSKKSYTSCQVLVSTWQKTGTGFDEATACKNFWEMPVVSDTMIFEDLTADEEIFIQNMGRVMRVKNGVIPSIILYKDLNASSKRQVDGLKSIIKETNGTIYNVKPFEVILPRYEQIFMREMRVDIFFRVCTLEEYNLFKEYYILDDNDYDKSIGGMEIFDNSDTMLVKYNTPGLIVLVLTSLTTATNGNIFIATCPICNFQVVNVSQL